MYADRATLGSMPRNFRIISRGRLHRSKKGHEWTRIIRFVFIRVLSPKSLGWRVQIAHTARSILLPGRPQSIDDAPRRLHLLSEARRVRQEAAQKLFIDSRNVRLSRGHAGDVEFMNAVLRGGPE